MLVPSSTSPCPMQPASVTPASGSSDHRRHTRIQHSAVPRARPSYDARMRPLGVVALVVTGCLSAPPSGDRGGGGDPDASGVCASVELPDTTPAPVAWVGNVLDLEFDDLGDHVFHDRSGQGHDVAIRGHARIDGVDPEHGRALELAGTDGLILPDDTAFDLETFTIELWILRHDQGGSDVALLSDFATGTWELTLGISGQPTFGIAGSAIQADPIPVDTWTHVAVVRDDDGTR